MAAKHTKQAHWGTTAFMVEALVLLAVLVACMAVFTQLFAHALTTTHNSERLSSAVAVAQSAAEEFSADPVAVCAGQEVGQGIAAHGTDEFSVSCNVSSTPQEAGTLYAAHISVSDENGQAYELDATRYVSKVKQHG